MKSLKNLIIPFIIMVVLAGIAIGVIVANSKTSSEPSDSLTTSTDVLVTPINLISSIEVINKDGTGIGFQGSPDETGNMIWTLMDEYATDVPLNNNAISSWVYVLSNFSSSGTLGNASELSLSEYGLDEPVYTIVITGFDGTVNRVFVGNKTADGSNCYFMLEGDDNVYTIVTAKYTYCGFQLIDFLETVSFGIDYASLSTVEFKRDSDGIDLVASCALYETGDPVFTAISPFRIECSPYFVSFIDSVVNLEIASFVDIPEESLSDYGLDDPSYEFIFTMNDGRIINVSLSSSIGGFYYGTSNMVDGYFKVSEMQINGLDTQLMMMLGNYLVYYPATDISEITGSYNGDTFTYDIETEGSISDDDATADLNGRDAKVFTSSGRSYAAILYESLITISVSDVDAEADPEFDPEIEFVYKTKSYETYTLSFVQRDNNSYYVFLNGEYTYFVVPTRELFNDSGTDTYNYGAWTAYELARQAIDNQVAGIYDIPSEE